MADPNAALATQLRHIEARTGQSLDQLRTLIAASGLEKHGEVRAMLMQRLGLGHGDANTLAHAARAEPAGAAADPLDTIYTGAKAQLRPLHEQLVARIDAFGPYEKAPKKAYVSLRRSKQFAMVGPATKALVEIGLNAKALPPAARLKPMPAGGMCAYTVRIASVQDLDAELVGWLRSAYDAAG